MRGAIALGALLLAVPAMAEQNATQTCLRAAEQNASDPGACAQATQATCLDNAIETPAKATLCFVEARAEWSAALAARIAALPENGADVVRIETKYDLLGTLLQCDRLKELTALTTDSTDAEIAFQAARCQAAATWLAYLRLDVRAPKE